MYQFYIKENLETESTSWNTIWRKIVETECTNLKESLGAVSKGKGQFGETCSTQRENVETQCTYLKEDLRN